LIKNATNCRLAKVVGAPIIPIWKWCSFWHRKSYRKKQNSFIIL